MALILHLTDIHIGDDQPTDDHKVKGLISYTHRHDRFKTYCSTLRSVAKHLNGQKLDAVVVSGDITVANSEDGYILFDKLIDSLGSAKPSAKNIVVVPGNHDVKWGEMKPTAKKYEFFLKYIRNAGYTTPFIDSIDKATKRGVILNFINEKIQIVPINTSHYCGTQSKFNKQDSWETAKTILESVGKKDLAIDIETEINKNLLHDISRVSPDQLEYLSNNINTHDKSLFRIAVTHHPLTAVSISEEVKAFESITNLGEIRNFLLENDFKVLIHGHKHKQAVFWDLIPDLKNPYNNLNKQSTILVISGTQLSYDGSLEKDICRLIEVKNNGIYKTLKIQPINATQAGGRINFGDINSYEFHETLPPINKLITGGNVNETYNGIIDHFHNETDKTITNLICEVQNNSNNIDVPDKYPIDEKYKTQREKKDWVNTLVQWWAKKETSLKRTKYTHGGRLYSFGESKINQINYIVKALAINELTSRGVAVLRNPDEDSIEELNKGPAFCLIQFFIKKRDNSKFLDCIAYFRNQEMRHWWLINVAEIINIQNVIIKELNLAGKNSIKNGNITTIATLAYLGEIEARPLVVIPRIDILYDEENSGMHYGLTDLAYSLLFNQIPNREGSKKIWIELLDDMIPNEIPDPNGIPIAIEGLKFLSERMKNLLERVKKNQSIENLVLNLKSLLSKNIDFNRKYFENVNTSDSYTTWKNDCTQIINAIKKQIVKIYKIKPV